MFQRLKQRYGFAFFICLSFFLLFSPYSQAEETAENQEGFFPELQAEEEGEEDSEETSEFFSELDAEEDSIEGKGNLEEDFTESEGEELSEVQDLNFSEAPPHDDIKEIIDKGELVVALTNEQNPPWFFKDEDGFMKGIDPEIARGLAKELEVHVRFLQQANSNDSVVDMVAERVADIGLSYISLTLDRSKKVSFTNPYAFLNQSLVLNRLAFAKLTVKGKKKPSIRQKLNQKKAVISVLNNTAYLAWALELFPKATFYLVDQWDDHFVEKLQKGDITAAFRADIDIRRMIMLNSELKAYVQPILLKDRFDTIHAAVHPDKDHLLGWVNDYIWKRKIRVTAERLIKRFPKLVVERGD